MVAEGYLSELEHRDGRPSICCSCPLVAARLTDAGAELANAIIPLAAPPVAAARYLRRLAGTTPLHVTYVGACPFSDTAAIDEQVAPREFLDRLVELGISLEELPTTFDDVLPPDRRRHLSLPGGLPTDQALAERALPYRLVEITGADYAAELAELLMGSEPLLLDLAPQLGCACSGAVAGMAPSNARAVVMALEPPRSPQPVIDRSVRVDVRAPLPATPPRPATPTASGPPSSVPADRERHAAPATASGIRRATPASDFIAPRRPTATGDWAMASAGRRTPTGVARQRAGAFPLALSDDGLLLPRAYVARRHSSPILVPIQAAPQELAPEVATPTVKAATPPPAGQEFSLFVAGLTSVVAHHIAPRPEPWRRRLDDAIARWWDAGYDTAVLQRARALSSPPDVDGLLETYEAAVAHLARLEKLAALVRPTLRGAPIFRDPRNVAAAESLVDGLFEDPATDDD